MIRWVRIAAIGLVCLSIVILGVGVGLFLIVNNRWEQVELHDWLRRFLGESAWDVWLPALIAGWLVAILALGVLFLWSVFYVWRRRQYESLIRRLERELIHLRNLPFEEPAPFEEERESPDPSAARLLERLSRGQMMVADREER